MVQEDVIKEDHQYIFTPSDSWDPKLPLGNELEQVLTEAPGNLIELPDEEEAYSPIPFWKEHFATIALYAWCTLFVFVFSVRLFLPVVPTRKRKLKPNVSSDVQHVALGTFLKSEKDGNAQKALFNALHDPSAGLGCIKSLFPTDFVVDPNNEADLPRVLGSDCPECVAIPLQIKIDDTDE
uniref:Transmembrane protein n=1 Tax=Panagrellus redivivus TaxID=6233 RepID=A0A7E5A0M8_PANRE